MASASPDRTTSWSLSETVPQGNCPESSAGMGVRGWGEQGWSPEGMGVWRWGESRAGGAPILEKGGMPGSRGRCPRATSRTAKLLGDLGLAASVSGAQFAQV